MKKVVLGVQQAAEEKKISAVLDHISKSYRDTQGNDYNTIKGILAYYFFRHQKVSVYIPNVDVVVSGPTAHSPPTDMVDSVNGKIVSLYLFYGFGFSIAPGHKQRRGLLCDV